MSRALSAPAPATPASCHATCSRTTDAACRALLANEIALNNPAVMAEAPAIRVMLNCECAVRCLIAPEPAARFRPAADSSPNVAGRSVELELPAPGAGSP
eukprot:14460052-Alexandrium_andersonii.AAC.1